MHSGLLKHSGLWTGTDINALPKEMPFWNENQSD